MLTERPVAREVRFATISMLRRPLRTARCVISAASAEATVFTSHTRRSAFRYVERTLPNTRSDDLA